MRPDDVLKFIDSVSYSFALYQQLVYASAIWILSTYFDTRFSAALWYKFVYQLERTGVQFLSCPGFVICMDMKVYVGSNAVNKNSRDFESWLN